ncbi:hypothetical protein Ahia01_000895700 [Argonauta hians]
MAAPNQENRRNTSMEPTTPNLNTLPPPPRIEVCGPPPNNQILLSEPQQHHHHQQQQQQPPEEMCQTDHLNKQLLEAFLKRINASSRFRSEIGDPALNDDSGDPLASSNGSNTSTTSDMF